MVSRIFVKFRNRRFSDASFRSVDDSFESQTVVRLINQPHVSDNVFDLLPIVEFQSADNLVRNSVGDHFLDEKFLRRDTPALCKAYDENQMDELIEYIENYDNEYTKITGQIVGNVYGDEN